MQTGPRVPCKKEEKTDQKVRCKQDLESHAKKKDQKVRCKQDLESHARHLPIKSVEIIRNAYKCVQDRPVLIIMLVLNKTETKHKETNAAQHGSSFVTFYKKMMGFGVVHQSLIFLPLS